jgi:DNA sulfur modification protein DndB
MNSEVVGNLTIRRAESFGGAQQQAMEEALNTLGQVIPVILFRQGNRVNLSGAMTFGMVSQLLYSRSAKQRDTIEGVVATTNRPEDKKHSVEIADYVLANRKSKYYLGTLSLNIQEPLTLYTSQAESKMQLAYLVLPKTARISITDGQHRQSAIKKALDRLPPDQLQDFASESISVLITCEMDISQIHQDFADASKTKPLPPGLLAVYDMRNPANRVVIELERNVALFRARIDSTSKTLSKNSSLLYTANQLRQFVKVFLTGSWQMGSVDFEKTAHDLLDVEEGVFERELGKATEFVNYLAERIPVWRQIAHLPAGGTTAAQIRDLRQDGYVCLTAVGLVIIARIGHELFKVDGTDWQPYAARLADLDWRNSGAIWQGNVVSGGRIISQQALMRGAVNKVRTAIGLAKPGEATETAEGDAAEVEQQAEDA